VASIPGQGDKIPPFAQRRNARPAFHKTAAPMNSIRPATMTRLDVLEAESIHIFREVIASFQRPVMLYSIGKDSTVLLHLLRKAFAPARPAIPLLHVDTTWKFAEMIAFRDRVAAQGDVQVLVHINEDGVRKGISPLVHGATVHTDVMKTEALKQALDKFAFDAAIGGARRDEEKSRAKERVFSFRTSQHRWDPKSQRPELWSLYNTHIHQGESVRVFPLSNWTEMDVWEYIRRESIEVVPLYFAKMRPTVQRDGALIMVDDDRFVLRDGERIVERMVRFRTLGDYPLTGAVESSAASLDDIIAEMASSRSSERQGRVIDHDPTASMERKKQEGYF
jgi:sulfate adenylyltransferase subunit 2